MPWIQLKLNTTGANAEELSDALMEAGAVSITFQDTHDTPVFEPLPGETRLWGDTDVIGLFDAETDMKDVVAILEQHPLLGAGFAHKIEQLEDKDWNANGWIISIRCVLASVCGFVPAGVTFRTRMPST